MDKNGYFNIREDKKSYKIGGVFIILVGGLLLLFSMGDVKYYVMDESLHENMINLTTSTMDVKILEYTTKNIIDAPNVDNIKGLKSMCFYTGESEMYVISNNVLKEMHITYPLVVVNLIKS